MISIKSKINIIDNSGGRLALVLNILSKSWKSVAIEGDILVVTLKKIIPNKKVEKGKLYKAMVVKIINNRLRYGGVFLKFNRNGAVLLSQKKSLLGTRILGIVSQELKKFKCVKILSLAPSVV